MAAIQNESQATKNQEKYSAELQEIERSGQPMNLTTISGLSEFRDHIANVDVTITSPGGVSEEYSEGLFTVHTVPQSYGVGGGIAQPALNSSEAGYPHDADIMFFVANLTKVGYIYTGSSSRTSVNKIRVTDRMAMTPAQLAETGFSWSPTDPHTLISQSTINNYTFTDPTTSDQVDILVTQQTTPAGDPIGGRMVAAVPLTPHAGNTTLFSAFKESIGFKYVMGSAAAGVVTFFVVYQYAAASAAATAATVGETTGLISGVAATSCALGPFGVAVLAGVVVALLILATIALVIYFYSETILAYFMIVTDPPTASVVHTSDGTITYDDGTVQFMVNPTPPLLPSRGSPWVGATRNAAINQQGELWVLNGSQWTYHSSGNTYTSLEASGSWFATIATDPTGASILEIPDEGPSQPPADSAIRKDVDMLNSGKDPRNDNEVIDPPVPGWKEFIPGIDSDSYGPYGLALATDGRVFGVGSNRDGQCNLKDRYTHIATSISFGTFSNSAYSLGIRSDTGEIDFAGDNWYSIRDGIESAGLTNVIDIAAGPDRAIAVTKDGGTWLFGRDKYWDKLYIGPDNSAFGTYTAISATLPTKDENVGTFVATQLNENTHASFSADQTSGSAPLTVRFTDTSTGNPTSWKWEFGDGTSSNDQNPTHTYSGPGEYTVALTTTVSHHPLTTRSENFIHVLKATPDVPSGSSNTVSAGGSGSDYGTYMIKTADGGFITIGSTDSTDGDLSGVAAKGTLDVWIAKRDASLTILWKKRLGGSRDNAGISVIQRFDSNRNPIGYAFVAATNSKDKDIPSRPGDTNRVMWVGMTDLDGNIVSQKSIGGTTGDTIGSALAQAGNGDIVVVGSTSSPVVTTTTAGEPSATNNGAVNALVAVLDANANVKQLSLIGGTARDWATDVAATNDGGFVVLGGTQSDGTLYGSTERYGLTDITVTRFAYAGPGYTKFWANHYGGRADDSPASIILGSNGDIVFAGSTKSGVASPDYDLDLGKYGSTQHGPDYEEMELRTSDIWVVVLNGQGTIQWQRCYGAPYDEIASMIRETADGKYIISGAENTNTVTGDITTPMRYKAFPQTSAGYNAWVFEIPSAGGNPIWDKSLGGSYANYALAVAPLSQSDDGVMVLGYTDYDDGDVLPAGYHGDRTVHYPDQWLFRLVR